MADNQPTFDYSDKTVQDSGDFDSFFNASIKEQEAPVESPKEEPVVEAEAPVESPKEEAKQPVSPIEAARAKEKARLSQAEKLRIELEEKNRLLAQYQDYEKKLAEAGWDVNQLASTRNPHAKAIDPALSEVQSLRKQIELDRTLAADRDLLADIKDHLSENESEYEYVLGNEHEVLDLLKTVKSSGKPMTISDAVKALEDVYEQQAEALSSRKANKANKKGIKANTETSIKEDIKTTQAKPVEKKVVSEEEEFLESMRATLRETKPKTIIKESTKASNKFSTRSSSSSDFESFLKERLK
jgi:hypothetical protein